MVFPRQLDQRLTSFGLHIRGINNCQLASPKALANNGMQQVERVVRCRLVVFVIGDQASARVRGDDFSGDNVISPK